MTTANAIYTNSTDQTIDLVVLDDTDCVVEVIEEDINEARQEAIYAGQTEYRVAGMPDRNVMVGDGDSIDRLTLR